MLERFWHWWMARVQKHEGHTAFADGCRAYMAYLNAHPKRYDLLDENDLRVAGQDAGLLRAETLYLEARKIAEADGRTDSASTTDYQLGMLYHLQGRLDEALDHLERAVVILNAKVVVGRNEREMLSGCYYHQGILAMRRKDRLEAERLLTKSCEIDESQNDHNGAAMSRAALKTVEVSLGSSNAVGSSDHAQPKKTPPEANAEVSTPDVPRGGADSAE